MCETYAAVRYAAVYTRGVIAAENVGEVKHQVEVQVHEVKLRLVEPVAFPRLTLDMAAAFKHTILCGTFGIQAAVHQTETDTGG